MPSTAHLGEPEGLLDIDLVAKRVVIGKVPQRHSRQRVRHLFHRSYNTAVGQLPSHDRRLAMALQQGEVQGYNFDRMAVEFTMVNQGKVVPCSISTAAMDDLEGRRDVKSNQRLDQFMRLREIIEERASRKFFEEQAQADRPVVLRSNDFSS
jgi:hypothetical protein